ncbi:hypothetical protein GGI35DRAFT_279135 [Trichoderma velutinum]
MWLDSKSSIRNLAAGARPGARSLCMALSIDSTVCCSIKINVTSHEPSITGTTEIIIFSSTHSLRIAPLLTPPSPLLPNSIYQSILLILHPIPPLPHPRLPFARSTSIQRITCREMVLSIATHKQGKRPSPGQLLECT